ncbi:tyrosine-type recombinase/integrase [Zavarzinella formosa]|uniref:tyrosine-type recombinase/integrase n=1 Tax=Zavarzinella formosa TaxID=360055 RepID=UPI0002F27197|nr:site-specific integrase [Zavarzinella formosa]
MASLQERNGSYRVQFFHHGKLQGFTIGKVSQEEANAKMAQVEYLLLRLKQKLVAIPDGVDIATFLEHDGKPPSTIPTLPETKRQAVTLGHLRDRYLDAHGNGTVEANTLYTINIHLAHACRVMGEELPVGEIDLGKLQDYVNRRVNKPGESKPGKVGVVTVRKELATLRAAWNWGELSKLTSGKFPNKGLRFPKTDEKPPFMTMDEVTRRVTAGGDPEVLWESVYLLLPEIEEMLAVIKANALHPFVYPLAVFAAYTGARRSEIMRAQIGNVDFEGQAVVIHEKKRSRDKRTHRRVPMTPQLDAALREWLEIHPGGPHLFCHGAVVPRSKKRSRTTGHQSEGKRPSGLKGRMATVRNRGSVAPAPLSPREVYDQLRAAVKGTKWEALRGMHFLRHSFCSHLAMKGVDQRMIDEFVGHQSEEQKKRYRHLSPNSKADVMKSAFA